MKNLFVLIAFVFTVATMQPVSAHVSVKPAEVGIGAWQTFSVNVPVEKPIATTGVRVVIPEGLSYVTPNVKPGWTIEVKKTGTGEEATVSEIIWTGGEIPAGQRDEFVFSAKVPSTPGSIQWKAYQTYEDGNTVAWDQPPVENQEDFSTSGPYSESMIVDDLSADAGKGGTAQASQVELINDQRVNIALGLSVVALVLAGYAVFRKQ